MKQIYLISSITENSRGGINSLAILFIKIFQERILNLNPIKSRIQFLKSFFIDANYIVIGYADTAVYISFPLFLFLNKRIIYIPCYHPSYAMRRKFLAKIYENTIFKIYLSAKTIICLSEHEIILLKKLNPKGNYVYIPMPSALINSPPCIKEKITKNKIIFVGRDDSNKNLSEFIHIAKRLRCSLKKNYEFIVISKTNRALPDWITLKTDVSDSDLRRIYISTAAIIIPSKWESLSLAGIETIQFGGKVICNHNVMLSNLMETFETLILNEYEDINTVRSFLEQEINADQQRLFSEYFSETQFVKKFQLVFDNLI